MMNCAICDVMLPQALRASHVKAMFQAIAGASDDDDDRKNEIGADDVKPQQQVARMAASLPPIRSIFQAQSRGEQQTPLSNADAISILMCTYFALSTHHKSL